MSFYAPLGRKNLPSQVPAAVDSRVRTNGSCRILSRQDLIPLQNAVGNRVVCELIAGARSVQRVVKFQGVEQKEADLNSVGGPDWQDTHRAIVRSWMDSTVVHDFIGKNPGDQLVTAVEMAVNWSGSPLPELFQRTHLAFVTVTEHRLPTLYFQSGKKGGRIRQQHGSGPAILVYDSKKDFFFTSQEDQRNFGIAAGGQINRAFTPINGKTIDGKKSNTFNPVLRFSDTPETGRFHSEVFFYENGTVDNHHPSGGTVRIPSDIEYPDEDIRSIFGAVRGSSL